MTWVPFFIGYPPSSAPSTVSRSSLEKKNHDKSSLRANVKSARTNQTCQGKESLPGQVKSSILLCACDTWTLLVDLWEKGSRISRSTAWRSHSASPIWSTRLSPAWSTKLTIKCGVRSTSLWAHRNLFWQLSRNWNLHGSDMSCATTASPKLSFRASWKVGDAVVGKGNAGWTTSKSGQPCPCQNCSHGPPAEKNGGGSVLIRPLRPPFHPLFPRRPNRQREWTEN